MKWRFWRKHDSLEGYPAANLEAASSAEATVTEYRKQVRADRKEVATLAERLRTLRRENHFAEKIEATFSERYE